MPERNEYEQAQHALNVDYLRDVLTRDEWQRESDDLRQRFGLPTAPEPPESPRPADEDRCGGRNTLTRHASGDVTGYAASSAFLNWGGHNG